jgi:hypothetical protein
MSKVIKYTMLMIRATVQLVASQVVDGHTGLFMILSQFGSNRRTTSVCMYGSHVPVCRELSQKSAIPCNFWAL